MNFGSRFLKVMLVLLLSMSFLAPSTFAQPDPSSWNRVSFGTRLFSVAWSGSSYVAVGDRGTIYQSTDGVSWTFRESPVQGQIISSVAWGNNTFVAITISGEIISSPDGANWTLQRQFNTMSVLTSVKWINNQFIAVGINYTSGANGQVLSSPDGVNWTLNTNSVPATFNDIDWGGGQYVAVGSAGAIYTSMNLTDWERQTSNINSSNHLYSVAWGNDMFVAAGTNGYFCTSTDGVNWEIYNFSQNNQLFSSVIWANDTFMILGNTQVLISADGEDWTSHSYGVTGQSTDGVKDAVWGDNKFLAVGDKSIVFSSDDGEQWSPERSAAATSKDLKAVIYGERGFVAVGEEGMIISSSDGAVWTKQTSGVPTYLQDIAWGNGIYAAVGSGKDIMTSSDAVTWSPVTTTSPGFSTIAWGNGKFVAGGTGSTLQTSSDGTTWTPVTVPATYIPSISWVGDRFIASTSEAKLLFSNDGVTWTAEEMDSNMILSRVVKGNDDKYLALVQGFDGLGKIASSTDGIHWTASEKFPGMLLRDLHYIGNQYTVVDNWGYIYTSNDGESWTTQNSRIGKWQVHLADVTWGNDRLVAVGGWNLIYNAPLVLEVQPVGSVTGTVVDSNHSPINGATVSIGQASTTTNSAGAFTLSNVPSGARSITASAPGYLSGNRNVSVVSGQAVDAGEILLQTADVSAVGTVTGFVYDPNDDAIHGAMVSIGQINTTTNEQGAFSLTNIPAGLQTIQASALGYANNSKSVTVIEEQNIDAGIIKLTLPIEEPDNGGNNPSPNPNPTVPTSPTSPTSPTTPSVPTTDPTDTKTEEGSETAENTPDPSDESGELVQDPNDIFKSQVVRADSNVITGVQARTAEILKAGSDAQPINYSDINQHWAISSIKKLTRLGVINGYPSGGFGPDDQITRAEFAAMITRGFVDMAERTVNIKPEDFVVYSDINNHWSSEYLKKLVSVGVMTGYGDGTIRPEQTITRQEMAIMITRVLNPYILNQDTTNVQFTDLNGSFAQEEIKKATALGIFNGKTGQTFDPLGGATRAESIETIIKTYRLSPAIREALSSLD